MHESLCLSCEERKKREKEYKRVSVSGILSNWLQFKCRTTIKRWARKERERECMCVWKREKRQGVSDCYCFVSVIASEWACVFVCVCVCVCVCERKRDRNCDRIRCMNKCPKTTWLFHGSLSLTLSLTHSHTHTHKHANTLTTSTRPLNHIHRKHFIS